MLFWIEPFLEQALRRPEGQRHHLIAELDSRLLELELDVVLSSLLNHANFTLRSRADFLRHFLPLRDRFLNALTRLILDGTELVFEFSLDPLRLFAQTLRVSDLVGDALAPRLEHAEDRLPGVPLQ